MFTAPSAFDAPATRPLAASLDWITATLQGDLAIGICVIAVAIVGMVMLTGRMPIRQGAHVILGCFILLGAPVVASGFSGIWQDSSGPGPALAASEPTVIYERDDLPPATYNPYARASFRRD